MRRFIDRYSRILNSFVNILLYLIVFGCCAFFALLFIQPRILHVDSLANPDAKGLTPATVVTLVAALLISITSTLITRSVEHSLWLQLIPEDGRKGLTVGESRRLAQWSVSPLSRVTYVLNGHSILLRAGGIALLAIAVVSPVLVSGIHQQPFTTISVSTYANRSGPWEGWLDVTEVLYGSDILADTNGVIAALATMSNLTVPASSICTGVSCSANATAAAIKASCTGSLHSPNINMVGSSQSLTAIEVANVSETYYSTLNPNISVTLSNGNLENGFSRTWAQFRSQYPFSEDPRRFQGAPHPEYIGQWAVIFGAFLNGSEKPNTTAWASSPTYLNQVDCLLTIGTVKIFQNGTNDPILVPISIEESKIEPVNDTSQQQLRNIYESDSSPYSFKLGSRGFYQETLGFPLSIVGSLLLGPPRPILTHTTRDAYYVARQIEKNFEMASLFAFSRSPGSSNITIAIETTRSVYVYQKKVLAVLLLPLLATLLGTWGRWKVGNSKQIVGYDPVEIARLGSVRGLSDRAVGKVVDKKQDEKLVWCYEETRSDIYESHVVVEKLAVGDGHEIQR